ncbi:uncharacterized protein LOC123014717 [Tribolium madens]|uniref:uncharacterized protein LOC123014717 n=1 Tax=Tribolium madens TaxID=41895 RepID=UPI001CF731F2|nr:uncharacterized protein LOC123014717 [Tribolium madens]
MIHRVDYNNYFVYTNIQRILDNMWHLNSKQDKFKSLYISCLVAALTILVHGVVQFDSRNCSKNMANKSTFAFLLVVVLMCTWMVEDAGVANYDVKSFGTFGSPNSFGEHF